MDTHTAHTPLGINPQSGVFLPDLNRPRLSPITGRLRRSTLVSLRWMAVAGQLGALLFVIFVMGFSLPAIPCLIFIGVSAFVNIIVSSTLPLDRRTSNLEACAQLAFDIFQLSALLWLTGGLNNPFALLLLAPVVTSATTLSRQVLASLSVLTASVSFALIFEFRPLPWDPPGAFELPFIFRVGFWLAILVGMVFTSFYAWRAVKESRRMSEALSATEAVLAQEQKLAALGGLAAAAAHELGTPLATIQLTAKELAREAEPGSLLREDIDLVLSQTQRCREILRQLSARGDEGDLMHDRLTLEALLEEAASPYRGLGTNIHIEIFGDRIHDDLNRRSEILYGLKNFIENAVGFAEQNVVLTGRAEDQVVQIIIDDDGPGFDASVRDRLGEPYVSSRAERSPAGGLGLGFFIAKTLIERTGGEVRFTNRPEGGARVTLRWPGDRLRAAK